MAVDSTHPEYDRYKPVWERNEDSIDGQDRIKANGKKYLPKLPGQEDKDYKAYLMRAVYDEFPGRVVTTSIGQLFRKRPTGYDSSKIVDLEGNNLERFSRKVARNIMAKYRAWVIMDYSTTLERPYLTEFTANQVINWRYGVVDGERKLTMIMISGSRVVDGSDRYKPDTRETWREYYIDETTGLFKTRTFEKNEHGAFVTIEEPGEEPLFRNDVAMTSLPVYPITPDGISGDLHNPPITSIVNATLAHYHNSADYENMLHITGAKTLITNGYGKEDVFPIGGRAEFSIDAAAGAEYLEASSDSGLRDAMKDKREIIAGMGGQYIAGRGRYVASAETSNNQGEGEHSTLADLANGLGSAFSLIMADFEEWETGVRPDSMSIEFNKDYESGEIQSGIITELITGNDMGAYGRSTLFHNLQKREIFPHGMTFDENEKEVAEEKATRDKAKAQAIKDTFKADFDLGDGAPEDGELVNDK